MTREQKTALGEMRASGVLGLMVYCADYRCGHLTKDQRGSMAGPYSSVRTGAPVRLPELRFA